MHSLARPGGIEQFYGSSLDDPSANPVAHMFGALPLEHEVRNSLPEKKLTEQEARWTRSDDYYLGAHVLLKQTLTSAR